MKASCDLALTIRPARPADALRLQEIEHAAGQRFTEVGLPQIARMPPRSPDLLVRAAEAGCLWVAGSDDQLVDFALVERLADGTAHLEELSVDPAQGRSGIGTALMRHVERAMAARGHATLTLSTFREVPWNAPWYRRLGYRVLPDADLTPVLHTLRDEEAALGLDLSPRFIMRKVFSDAPENSGIR
ncbi:MAG: GNAT family N-acetyltransferase [Bacteroidota bacterium]